MPDVRSFLVSVEHEWLLRLLAAPRCPKEQGVARNGQVDEARGRGSACSSPTSSCTAFSIPDPRGLSAQRRHRRHARGRVVIVRYADDFVMELEKEANARETLPALEERPALGLALHADKTRSIKFGRLSARLDGSGASGERGLNRGVAA